MKPYVCSFALAVVLAFTASQGVLAAPGDAIASANQRSAKAEGSFRSCGDRFQGKAAIDCVATAVNAYSISLSSCGHIKVVAPQAAPTAVEAAGAIAGTATKPAALSVLNRASSVLRGLAAQSSGETQAVYNRINRAFQTAISVINSKG